MQKILQIGKKHP